MKSKELIHMKHLGDQPSVSTKKHSLWLLQSSKTQKWDGHRSSSDVCRARQGEPGHWYGNRGTEGTLHSPLTVTGCWVPGMCLGQAVKSAISKVDRMIWFCFSKSPKHNSWGDLAYNLFSAEPDDLRWAGLNAFGWVCLNIKTCLFALRIKFSFKLNPLNSHRPKWSVCYGYIQQSIVQLCPAFHTKTLWYKL